MNKIFAFWESKDKSIPAYLELCKRTWIKHMPNVEINILNHTNLEQYIGNVYDIEKLKKISFPMQSDIISAAVLEKFGGLFLDLDCIVVDDIFRIFNNISKDKLICFGQPHKNAIHLAVLYSNVPNNPILKVWRETAQKQLDNLPEKYNWSYFGNSIVHPLLSRKEYEQYFHIIDRAQSGNILESAVILDASLSDPQKLYNNFYFNPNHRVEEDILQRVTHGVISLHNSWTPIEYKQCWDINTFLTFNLPIVDILEKSLDSRLSIQLKNNIKIKKNKIFNYLENSLADTNPKLRFYKNMLVIDYIVNKIKFAFDVRGFEKDLFGIDLVLRDADSLKKVYEIGIEGIQFGEGNKVTIVDAIDKVGLLHCVRDIYQKIDGYKKMVELEIPKCEATSV